MHGRYEAETTKIVYVAILISAVLGLAYFFVFYFGNGNHDVDPPLELFAMGAGMLGAFLSMMLKAFQDTVGVNDSEPALILDSKLRYQIIVLFPIFIGMISGLLAYLLLASQFIKGPIFPEFECKVPDGRCNSFYKLVTFWSPKDAVDYLRTIVWCFLSGFFQRIVISDINKIVEIPKS